MKFLRMHAQDYNYRRMDLVPHCNISKISRKVVVKYSTTPQTCRYTTLWNTSVRKTEQPKVYNVIYDITQGVFGNGWDLLLSL